jgi:hypothetical protein
VADPVTGAPRLALRPPVREVAASMRGERQRTRSAEAIVAAVAARQGTGADLVGGKSKGKGKG